MRNVGSGSLGLLQVLHYEGASLPGSGGQGNLLIADIDGDLLPDWSTVSNHGLALARGNGNGTFAGVEVYSLPGNGVGNMVLAGDLDADADPDLVTSGWAVLENRR